MKPFVAASFISAALLVSTSAFAAPQQSGSQSSETAAETRPATPTVSGTTGIWYVPTSAVLPHRKWSVSFNRTNLDDGQGFADISTFPATFAVGVGNRAELFGSWSLVTRLDRDTRPLFFGGTATTGSDGTGGGILLNYPKFLSNWTGNKLGDLWLGGKLSLMPNSASPIGVALRAMVKVPVGDDTAGTSSGSTDFAVDGIVSTSNSVAELSGFGGVMMRGSPSGYSLTNGFRWGLGAAFPQRNNLGFRVTAELFGESYFNDTITAPAGLTGTDASPVPTTTSVRGPLVGALGLTWQAPSGFFVGAAASWNVGMDSRDAAGFPNTPKDDKGLQVRIGFHPGAHNRPGGSSPSAAVGPGGPGRPPAAGPGGAPAGGAVAPPAAAPAPAAPAAGGPGAGQAGPGAQNRPPTVTASCNPCSVEVGRVASLSADAQDPDGDPLTYQWTATAGTIASPTSRQTNWTAPANAGPVPVAVTVTDGRGGTARGTLTMQVTSPPQPQQFTFEDVHFEFDRFNLRADALRILDSAVTAMQANPTLRLEIEGHTCNIGTPEYNLALGERRARAVRDYLTSRGISADRLRTVSYGEERPKYDNAREETRRLNRRAALVVRLQ